MGKLGLVLVLVVGVVQIVWAKEVVVITKKDVQEMRRLTPAFFEPTQKALIQRIIETKVLAREALKEGVTCTKAKDAIGLEKELILTNCYLKKKLNELGLKKGAVQSYYLTHKDRFGRLPLEKVREWIRNRILRVKMDWFRREEFKRIKDRYEVKVCLSGGC